MRNRRVKSLGGEELNQHKVCVRVHIIVVGEGDGSIAKLIR